MAALMVTSVLFVVLLVVRQLIVKTGYFNRLFDERQRRIWSEANKLTLYGILTWSSLLLVSSWFQEAKLSLTFFYMSTLFVGAVLQQVYRIWQGAYLPWNKSAKWGTEASHYLLLSGLATWTLLTTQASQSLGWEAYILETEGAIFFFNALLFVCLFLICLLKWVVDKRQGDED